MRMRRKKHGAERIAACSSILIENPLELIKDPTRPFCDCKYKPIDFPNFIEPDKRLLCLEIGCGKGSFACRITEKEHGINLIALERVADVACLALEKAMASSNTRPDNLRFIIGDAHNLRDYFPSSSVERIYINFCDPWTKKGYAKRRLTHRTFLEMFRELLTDGGELHFKTDNKELFDFSLSEFEECRLETVWYSRDLHNSDRALDNIVTEYEASFASQGIPINCAIVKFHKNPEAKKTHDKPESENRNA